MHATQARARRTVVIADDDVELLTRGALLLQFAHHRLQQRIAPVAVWELGVWVDSRNDPFRLGGGTRVAGKTMAATPLRAKYPRNNVLSSGR